MIHFKGCLFIFLQIKEDKERFLELKRMESEYEARRTEMMKEYQAVKSAQEVSIEDIPLPSLPMESPSSEPATDSIIKQSSLKQVSKVPPGCPQGLPPTLGEFEGTEDDVEETDDEQESGSHKRVHFSSEDALKSDKDSNLTDFLNEIEKIERLSGEKIGNDQDNGTGKEAPDQSLELPPDAIAAAASGQLSVGKALILPENSRLPLQPAPPVASVPPLNLQPIFPPASVRPSTLPKFGGAPRLSVPQLGHGLPHMIPPLRPNAINANVRGTSNATSKSYTFLPSNSTSPFTKNSDDRKPQGTTISAKPQLRNLSADSTRFMPLSLRLKRDERPGVTTKRTPQSLGKGYLVYHRMRLICNIILSVGYGMISHTSSTSGTSSSSLNTKEQKNSKDDAYVDFMKEMSGFM